MQYDMDSKLSNKNYAFNMLDVVQAAINESKNSGH